MLTATWPLAGDTTEKLLLAAEGWREKVKAAELAGGKEAPKLSPEEQEVAEEMAAQAASNGGNEEEPVKPGEPHFVFVARLSPQDRQTALAEAFTKAKAQAAELAKAAGAGFGAMTGLSGDGGTGGMGALAGMNASWRYNPYAARENYEWLQQVAQTAGGEEQQGEAMAPKPDGIAFDFAVNATFAVLPK